MAYQGDLGSGLVLYLENRDLQTNLTLSSSNPGQQQSQSTGLQTGRWTMPPSLFRTSIGFILRIEASQGQFFLQIQAGALQVLSQPPLLTTAEMLPLHQVSESQTTSGFSMPPMEPMKPMELRMGNMQMRMEPMQMQMGDMQLQMPSSQAGQPSRNFCSQCGSRVGAGDRFCSHCGHPLAD